VAFAHDGTIVALAQGMQLLSFRIAEGDLREALHDGGEPVTDLDGTWVRFRVFVGDMTGSRARLSKWATRSASAWCASPTRSDHPQPKPP
jgi:hypothetical protein